MKTLFSLRSLVLLISVHSFAQNETNHWMFGQNAGLDFSAGAPVPESGCMVSTNEGSAAISDPVTGDLLMYTDGVTVYTANHTVMPNGTGLKGHSSSTQAALILPKPGSSTHFYIFTSDCSENNGVFGYHYSVVDMALNGGLGDVISTQKNISLFTNGSEQLSAVKHANCTDWWIMTKERGNNVYRAYLLTSAGVSAPIISSIGSIISTFSAPGQAKFSPNGTKYAIATSVVRNLIQLFDFDNVTGLLSNPITLLDVTNEHTYGLSFSGDNSKLYAGRSASIYQYDLSSGVPATIIASGTMIIAYHPIGQFQLGKDFKIYISNIGSTNLSVINNPNALGAACGFSTGAVPIAGSSFIGLCNFPDNYFNQGDPCPTIITTKSTNVSCYGTNDGTAALQIYNIDGPYTVSWSPGGATTDSITGLAPGTYTATITDVNGTVTNASVIITGPDPFTVTISGNSTVNLEETTTLTANVTGGIPAYSYLWSTGSSDNLPSVIFNLESTTHVQVTVTDNSGCKATATLLVNVEFTPQIPNIITPNGDGVNDVFKIHNLPSASSLDILNRWGNRVFTTENYTNDWSENSSDGVYFYLLQLPDGRKFSGFVQVVTNR